MSTIIEKLKKKTKNSEVESRMVIARSWRKANGEVMVIGIKF